MSNISEFVLYHCYDCANEIKRLFDMERNKRLLYDILDSEKVTYNFKDYMYNILNPRFEFNREEEIKVCIEVFNKNFDIDEEGNYIANIKITKIANDANLIFKSVQSLVNNLTNNKFDISELI